MKIFIISFTLLILTAVGCSSNNAGQANHPENKSGSGLAMPQAIKLFASTENNDLKAFIIIDNQEPQPMQIVHDRVQFDFSKLTPGNHRFEIEFKYTSIIYNNETFTLASAAQVANLAPGNNDIIFAASDYKMDCDNCDNDKDGIVNIVELAGGTNPADSLNEPTFTSRSLVKISEKTDAILLTTSAIDPNEDTVSFSITDGDHQALFDLDSVTGALRFKSTSDFKTNRGTNNQYFVEVTATDGANETPQLITITVVHFFVADDGINGEELWISDGVKDGPGTLMVKDINPNGHSSPAYFAFLNGQVFFSAYDEEAGRELWKSDGTFKGTERIMDINPGSGDSGPTSLTVMGEFVYFSAYNGTNTELWKSDGSDTRMVKDINTSGHSFPNNLASIKGELFFGAYDGTEFSDLWKSDGSDGGTELIREFSTDSAIPAPSELTDVDDILFFSAVIPGISGKPHLWKSQLNNSGASVSAEPVKDSNDLSISTPINLIKFDGTLYFSSDHEFSENDGIGRELWKSDGTPEGTNLVKDINPNLSGNSWPTDLTVVDGLLYFSAFDGTDTRLWKSDGIADPSIVDNIGPLGLMPSFPSQLINVNGSLFFSANDGTNGFELWKANSTEIAIVEDIQLNGDSFPDNLTAVNDALFFSANDGISGRELWHSDGITTYRVIDINRTKESSIPDGRGLVALYEFNEGTGKLIKDESDAGAGEALVIDDANVIDDTDAVTWVQGGLSINKPILIHSPGGVAKINQAIKSTNELTVELWIQPDNLQQGQLGKFAARIMTISNSRATRNITISQAETQLEFRVRTSETSVNGNPANTTTAMGGPIKSPVNTLNESSLQQPQHIVVTHNTEGAISATLNGKTELLAPELQRPGNFSNWDITLPLVIGNELLEDIRERNWQGTIFRIAIYDCVLSDNQIDQNFQAGSENPLSASC